MIWFSAAGNANAWVDTTPSGCKPDEPICSDNVTGSVTQVLLDCEFDEEDGNAAQKLYLHVQNLGRSPSLVRLAQYTSSGGSIYVLAATTGVPGGPTYEVADIWVSPDGATTALRLEGTL